MRWFLIFLGGTLALVAAVLALIWALDGFGPLDIEGPVLLALIGGSVATAALTVGLMALVFHSNRSGRDEEID
jgi:hypothetical protein